MSVQVSYKKQFLFGILFLILILIVVEVFVHIYDFFTKTCKFVKSDAFDNLDTRLRLQICYDFQDLEWSRYPELHLKPDQHMKTININNDGFRGQEIHTKPQTTYRIFMVGGSTTFGSGSTSDTTTIPGYLQQLFNNSTTKNIEIINAGIPSADSTTESELIKNKIVNYNPDLIIVYDGWNDVRGNINELKNENIEEKPTITTSILNNIKYYISQYRTLQIIQKYLYYSNEQEWTNRVIYSHDSSNILEKVKIWESNWNNICKLVKQNSFDILITLQPISGSSDRKLTDYEHTKYIQNDNAKMIESLAIYAQYLNNLECSNVADLRNVFDHIEGPIFYDEGHTTDRGNFIVAKKLYELSLPIILNYNNFNATN